MSLSSVNPLYLSDHTCGFLRKVDFPDPNRKPIYTLTRHTGQIKYTHACSPIDATLVATGGGDARGILWKIGQGNRASELQGHSDSVSSLAFSYDGKFLASGSMDGIVQVWDVYGNLSSVLNGPNGGIEHCYSLRRNHARTYAGNTYYTVHHLN
ncbi:transducin/WD-like repeat-protein [Medicago truncatula]|uniref:Transducin/WD-like repeat-protein n=1 Tax=Medicago truncatula TaxID=3880 RepID=Q2HV85_MEDTR|nr:WD40-like [Medicago truncatula]AES80339.1 transducin/WD-like repeat-protein [Medicago truncatula]